jgi:hypothetical protein
VNLSFAIADANHYLSTCAVQHGCLLASLMPALLGRFLPKLGPRHAALFFGRAGSSYRDEPPAGATGHDAAAVIG